MTSDQAPQHESSAISTFFWSIIGFGLVGFGLYKWWTSQEGGLGIGALGLFALFLAGCTLPNSDPDPEDD